MKQGSNLLVVLFSFVVAVASAMAVPTVRLEGPSAPLQAGGGSFDVKVYISDFTKGPLQFQNGVPIGYEWDNRITAFTIDLEFIGGAPADFTLGHDPGGFGFIDADFSTYNEGRKVTLGPETPDAEYGLVGSINANFFGALWSPRPVETGDEILLATATFDYDADAFGLYEITYEQGGLNLFVRNDEYNAPIDHVVISGTVEIVPEPATLVLMAGGVLGLLGYGRRR